MEADATTVHVEIRMLKPLLEGRHTCPSGRPTAEGLLKYGKCGKYDRCGRCGKCGKYGKPKTIFLLGRRRLCRCAARRAIGVLVIRVLMALTSLTSLTNLNLSQPAAMQPPIER